MKHSKLFLLLVFCLFQIQLLQAQDYYVQMPEWEEAEEELFNLYKQAQMHYCDTTDLGSFEDYKKDDFPLNKRLFLEENQYDKILFRLRKRVIDKSDQLEFGTSSLMEETIELKIISKLNSEPSLFFLDLFEDCGGTIDWVFQVSLAGEVIGTVDIFYSSVKLGYESPIITFRPKDLREVLENAGIVF